MVEPSWVEDALNRARVALAAKYEQYQARRPDGAVYRIALDEVRWWRPGE